MSAFRRFASRILCAGACACQAVCGVSLQRVPTVDTKEALQLRRITEYWEEKNFDAAKGQILSYLSLYPATAYDNELNAMLGDLYFRDNQIDAALACYQKLNTAECLRSTTLHRLQCLLHLQKYVEALEWSTTHPINVDELSSEQKSRLHAILGEALYRLALESTEPGEIATLAQSAATHYALIDAPFQSSPVTFAVAHIKTLLGKDLEAAELYLQLAEGEPQRAPTLLFRAAELLARDRPQEAVRLFGTVAQMEGEYQTDAAYNRLILLFEAQDYTTFVEEASALGVGTDFRMPILQFCHGVALQELGEYTAAVAVLEAFLRSGTASPSYYQQGCLRLFACARELRDLDLIRTWLATWKATLPMDTHYAQGLVLQAHMACAAGDIATATSALQELLQEIPEYTHRESALYDYAQCLLVQGQWQDARHALQRFLVECPASTQRRQAWQNLLFTSMQMAQNAIGSEQNVLRALFTLDVKTALAQEHLFEEEERRAYRFALIQFLFATGEKAEAIEMATAYNAHYPDHPTQSAVYLILAASHLALGSPVEEFIGAAENALAQTTHPLSRERLHLQLFNAYIADQNLNQATSHLIAAYRSSPDRIQTQNLFWLAHQLIHTDNAQAQQELASEVLETALCFDGKELRGSWTTEPLVFERQVFVLADAYVMAGKYQNNMALLRALQRMQQGHPDTGWRCIQRTQFALGQAHEKAEEPLEALAVYAHLIGDQSAADASYYQRAALLNTARLEYGRLEDQEKDGSNPKMTHILDTLKDLEIVKTPLSEPIHIEAALDYAHLRCTLEDPASRPEKMIFYLRKLHESLYEEDGDPPSSYLQKCVHWGIQEEMLADYLVYIEAEILRWNAEVAQRRNDSSSADMLMTQAQAHMDHLLECPRGGDALEKRVRATRETMAKTACAD